MAYPRLNSRSIRLFVATPDELAKKRPNLNAPYFRISRTEIEKALELVGPNADFVCSLGIWKRPGRDGKPDYFTAELSYPDNAEAQQKYLKKDADWIAAHPHENRDNAARYGHAVQQTAQAAAPSAPAPAEELLPF